MCVFMFGCTCTQVRSTRRRVRIPAGLKNTDSRRVIHEYANKLSLLTTTVDVNGVQYIEISHALGPNDDTPDQDSTYIDAVAVSLGLDSNWRMRINPHWEDEFVSYDTQHWSALFMMLASTKVHDTIYVCDHTYICSHDHSHTCNTHAIKGDSDDTILWFSCVTMSFSFV